MIRDRHVENYVAVAREMRRQFLADLARQAWAGLVSHGRRGWAKLSALNNPVGKIRRGAT